MRFKTCESVVEDLSKGVHSKRDSMDREVIGESIEHPESFSMDRVAVEKLLRMG